jgi:hypothetical protein
VTGSLTLAGWFNLESGEKEEIIAAKYAYDINDRAYRLDLRPGNKVGFIVSPDGTFKSNYLLEATPPFTLTTKTWYHLASVFDASQRTMTIYLDGTLIGSRSVTFDKIFNAAAPFTLGASLRGSLPKGGYDGLLDEWRIYSRALSQNEVQSLMNFTN